MSANVANKASTSLQTVRINEIFFSIQGESIKTGLPTAFIRLTGCPLRCRYCDTSYAFHHGTNMTINAIIQQINQYHTKHVTVTGGEPLAQATCHELLIKLCDEKFQVSLETSGAISIEKVDPRVMTIMDIKTPSSGESRRNKFENLAHLKNHDQIKFVICDRADYDWCKQKLFELSLPDICEVLFSPAYDSQAITELAEWVLEDKLNVRLQVQLHKFIWGDVAGH